MSQINDSNLGRLLVGARIPGLYRFVGTIKSVAVFQDVLELPQIELLCSPSLDNMRGSCVEYLPNFANCPRPVMEPSSLCVSIPDRYVYKYVGMCNHIYVTIMVGVTHNQPVCLILMITINAYQPQTVSSLYFVVFTLYLCIYMYL